jgi:opacity protein-like surface antigen
MYPMGGITLYGLLGYGQVDYDGVQNLSESGFQWGLGARHGVTENIGVFVDYTNFYDNTGFDGHFPNQDVLADSIDIGFSYKF